MKINVIAYLLLLCMYMFFVQNVKAENVLFNNDTYILKSGKFSEINKGYENEYYPENDKKSNWRKMIGIYYYPEIKDPIKFAQNADKEIETKASVVLLKFIANKKQDKAILSVLDIGKQDGKNYFEHDIYKYEQNTKKGMMLLKYAKKYFFSTDDEITKIGHEIRDINDDLMEQLIISPIPPIVEKDI